MTEKRPWDDFWFSWFIRFYNGLDPRTMPYTQYVIMLLQRVWVEKFESGENIFPPVERKPGPKRQITPELKSKVQEMFSGISRRPRAR